VVPISESIKERAITVVDVIKALAARGFTEEAENLLKLLRLRVSGDDVQTSALVRDGRILSAINDPNDYLGPGTGYRVSAARRQQMVAIGDGVTPEEVLKAEAVHKGAESKRVSYRTMGPAAAGNDRREVVIGVGPAFGLSLFPDIRCH